MPTISADALKRMLNLPANVVAVPVRPYAGDMDRCARCGERGRPYDRLGVRRWRHLDIGCTRLLLEHAPRRVDCAEHGVTVAMGPWAKRKSAYTRDFERQTAWLSVHAPRSAVSALMRVDRKSVGPICERVADELRAEQGAGLFDGLRSIGVDETGYRKGHTYMTVVVDHDRGRVIWMHQGRGQKVFDLFFQALTPARRESIRVAAGDGARWIDEYVFRWCPMAERILDGFHIVSWATDALDKVRTTAWREARKTGTAGKGAKDPVKGARRALPKNGPDLTATQRAQLECVANTNETLWEACKLKERLRMILRQTADEAAPVGRGRFPVGHRGVLETRREDRPTPLRHPAHHPVRTVQRPTRGREQQDQDHHQDRLRLPEPRQPHRPGHAQMRRTQPPTPRTPIDSKQDR